MACLGGSLAPSSDCTLQLAECFGLRAAECGATREVWSKGNEALVFDAPKNVSRITASVGHGGNLGAMLRVLAARGPTAAALTCLAQVSISFIAAFVAALASSMAHGKTYRERTIGRRPRADARRSFANWAS